ncbi:MFS transporter [Spongiactinospora rosea]|uniref:hypothetical protein n=1 Tax=Spongiactinospora rosea TaxID=2248750 RepID=UPI0013148968|nr:hypothetical protein [Spongiactinospora rosea]
MADPLTERSQAATGGPSTTKATQTTTRARDPRVSRVHDVVLGLLVLVAIPLAIVAVPNTISVVSALLPPGVPAADMVRAHGLALPAMMLTVPFAVVLVRRVPAAPVLVGGLTVLAVADVAGGFAGSPMLVGVLRALHGVGAGLLVPATLVAVRERPAPLRALWAATLAVSMLGAQALALWPLDDVTAWQVALQPYPMPTGIALALAAVHMMLRMRADGARPPQDSAEPGRHARASTAAHAKPVRRGLALTVAPAAAIAVLAFAISNSWPVPVVLLASLLGLVALLVVASLGGARPAAYVMVAVGAVVLPTGAQVTNMELGGLGGPGLSGLWPAFALTAVVAVGAAWAVARVRPPLPVMLGEAGLVALVAGLCAVWRLVPIEQGIILLLPFALIAAGAAVALTAALSSAGTDDALFALSLCFPAMLAGFLLGSGIQLPGLRAATSQEGLADAFLSALDLWTLTAGLLVVAVILLAAFLARREPYAGDVADAGAPLEMPDEPGRSDGDDAETGDHLAVPPPTPSPESGGSPQGR